MIFRVEDGSYGNYEKPCDEAYEISVHHWDIRVHTEDYFDNIIMKSEKSKWRDIGFNHCKINQSHNVDENGKWIARQVQDKKVWVVSLCSLEEFMQFIDKYGDCKIEISNYGLLDDTYNLITIKDKIWGM